MKLFAVSIVVALLIGGLSAIIVGENILVGSFETAYTDVTKGEGTWRGRVSQIQNSFEVFLEHPWVGTGARFIRQKGGEITDRKLLEDAYQGDLGWPHWLKNFGILGTLWVIALTIVVFMTVSVNKKRYPGDVISRFAEYHYIHLMIGMATINYLVSRDGILVFCLGLAMLHRRIGDRTTIDVVEKPGTINEDNRILRRKRAGQTG